MANNVNQQFGNYNPDIMPIYTTTPLNGLKGLSEATNYAPGCPDNRCMKYNSSAIKRAVQDVELVVVCLGTGLYIIFTSSLWYDVICLHLLVLTPSSIDKRTQDGSNLMKYIFKVDAVFLTISELNYLSINIFSNLGHFQKWYQFNNYKHFSFEHFPVVDRHFQ